MNEDTMKFNVISEDGQEIECEVMLTFESEKANKTYIVYTDNTKDDNGNTKVYASTYEPNVDNTVLSPIETEAEWKIIETILNELQEEKFDVLDRVYLSILALLYW